MPKPAAPVITAGTAVAAPVPVAEMPVSLLRSIIYSGLSGAIATTCIYPIDLTKTKLQDQKGVGAKRVYSGPLDAARKIIRAEGLRGMYRGWPPNVVLVMPEKALKLTLNDFFRRQLAPKDGSPLSLGRSMIAGGLAGTFQVSATNPMELLKIQGATMQDKFKAGEIKQMISYSQLSRQLGFSGMYTGVVATLMRDIPFSMLYFSLYAYSKERIAARGHSVGISSFLGGAVAGTFAAAVTTPLDVIKTRVHSNAVAAKISGSPIHVIRTFTAREFDLVAQNTAAIVKNEGMGAFFKGVVPRSAIIAPLFSITMSVYELLKATFH